MADDPKKKAILSSGEKAAHFNAGSDALVQALNSTPPHLSANPPDPLKKNAGGGGLSEVWNTPKPQAAPPQPPPPPPPPPPSPKKE